MSTLTDEKRRQYQDRLKRPLTRQQRLFESIVEKTLFLCGALSIVITVTIAVVLVTGSAQFFSEKEVEREITIVDKDAPDDGKVVGTCGGGTKKILYKRGTG